MITFKCLVAHKTPLAFVLFNHVWIESESKLLTWSKEMWEKVQTGFCDIESEKKKIHTALQQL